MNATFAERLMVSSALTMDPGNTGFIGRFARNGMAALAGLSLFQRPVRGGGCEGLPMCDDNCHYDHCQDNFDYCGTYNGCWDDGSGGACCDMTCEFTDCICEWAE
jgi:hypothetical protein